MALFTPSVKRPGLLAAQVLLLLYAGVWVDGYAVPAQGTGSNAGVYANALTSWEPGLQVCADPAHQPDEDDEPARTGKTSYTAFWSVRTGAGITGELPFWLHSNRQGQLDRQAASTHANLMATVHHRIGAQGPRALDLSAHGNLIGVRALDTQLRIHEWVMRAQWRGFMLQAERLHASFGLINKDLSTGSMDQSTNARPMPAITFATAHYRPLPLLGDWVFYDASLSHGWFDDHDWRYVEDVLLHRKHLYLRIFGQDAPFVASGGIVHVVQWGGVSPVVGPAPAGLRDWVDVFFSLKSDSQEIFSGGKLLNHFQNHLGTYDISFAFQSERWRLVANRQFYLEDTPNAQFATPWDGLFSVVWERHHRGAAQWRYDHTRAPLTRMPGSWWSGSPGAWHTGNAGQWPTSHSPGRTSTVAGHGLNTHTRSDEVSRLPARPLRPRITAVLYEHINTISQVTNRPGRDLHANYYNHWAYLGGWTYHGRAAGNPLYSGSPDWYGVINNKLLSHHLGMMGTLGVAQWRILATYSRNYGAHHIYYRQAGPAADASVAVGEHPATPYPSGPSDSLPVHVRLAEDGQRFEGLFNRHDQWSFLLEWHISAPGISSLPGRGNRFGRPTAGSGTPAPYGITVSLGADFGDLHERNVGLMVGWIRRLGGN